MLEDQPRGRDSCASSRLDHAVDLQASRAKLTTVRSIRKGGFAKGGSLFSKMKKMNFTFFIAEFIFFNCTEKRELDRDAKLTFYIVF